MPAKKEYPTSATLAKYGLTRFEFHLILASQGSVCPICGKVPSSGRWVIDHKHVRGFKKLAPEKRKALVRGITCWYCNYHYLSKSMNQNKANNIITYLNDFESRGETK